MNAAQSGARRWWALGALAISMLVIGIDLFVLSLALPTLSVDLHAPTSDLQWFVDAYSLALAATLLPAGLLGDRWGRRKMLASALGLFGVASLICAYASSSGELIAARAVLGVAAAVIMPMGLAVLPVLFTPAERPKAIGIVAGATFVGFPVGPILGGWLLDHFWWGSVFLINVPVVVLAVIAVLFLMPESRSSRRPRIDAGGVLISGAGLITLVYGVISAGQKGWSDPAAIATMIAGAVVLAGFGLWERMIRRRPGGEPLVDLSLFRSAGFAAGTTLSTLVQFALFGITFAMPQFFLDVWGLDSLASGVRLLPLVGGLAVGLGIGQRLQSPRAATGDRPARGPLVSVKVLATAGFVIMAAALAVGHRHRRRQQHGLRLGLVRAHRPGPGPGHADRHERRARRPVGRAQRVRLGADDHDAPGRRHDRGGRAGHRAQLGLSGPAAPGRPAARGGRRGPRQRDRRPGRRERGRTPPRCWRPSAMPTPAAWTSCCGSARPSPCCPPWWRRSFLPRQAGPRARAEPRPAALSNAERRCSGRISTMSDIAEAGRPAGLRERKKARTRAAIREHALRLFREQGYTATTVEQIAAAAEVSPATFFRYFPTKEDVVLQDDFDLVTMETLEAQPPGLGPIAAFRAAAAQVLQQHDRRGPGEVRAGHELIAQVPEIRARALDEFARTIDQIATPLAARAGRSAR